MMIKDTFSYDGPWDRVGLDCSYCIHFVGPETWPDKNKVSKCKYHDISLIVALGEDGYKNREWFCIDFYDNGKSAPKAVKHFNKIKNKLKEKNLYGLHSHGPFLEEINFNSL